jgi:hypothetical protein
MAPPESAPWTIMPSTVIAAVQVVDEHTRDHGLKSSEIATDRCELLPFGKHRLPLALSPSTSRHKPWPTARKSRLPSRISTK